MNGNYDENLLLGYIENELSDGDRATVERWMSEDPRLESLLSAMADDRQALRDMPEPAAPPWLMDDVDRGLERTMLIDTAKTEIDSTFMEQQHNARRIYAGLAAAAAVLIAGGVVIWSVAGPNRDRVAFQPDRPEVAMDTTTDSNETTDDVGDTETFVISKGGPIVEDAEPTEHVASKPGPSKMGHSSLKSGEPGLAQVAANSEPSPAMDLAQLRLNQNAAQEPVSIVVQTRDVNRSLEQLNFVANNINQALIEPYDYNGDPWPYPPSDTQQADTLAAGANNAFADQAVAGVQQEVRQQRAQEAAPNQQQSQVGQAQVLANRQAYTYNLILPADKVDKAVDMLQNSITGERIDFQDVNLNRFGEARRFDSLANARRNWPRRAPDYGDILRQQLPINGESDSERPVVQVVVPVILEPAEQAEQAPPTVQPNADDVE